jgi:hypothetical protein
MHAAELEIEEPSWRFSLDARLCVEPTRRHQTRLRILDGFRQTRYRPHRAGPLNPRLVNQQGKPDSSTPHCSRCDSSPGHVDAHRSRSVGRADRRRFARSAERGVVGRNGDPEAKRTARNSRRSRCCRSPSSLGSPDRSTPTRSSAESIVDSPRFSARNPTTICESFVFSTPWHATESCRTKARAPSSTNWTMISSTFFRARAATTLARR